MLEQLANQFLAMNAKSARNLVGSLSRMQKGGFSITDDQGAVDATEKPRISTASVHPRGHGEHSNYRQLIYKRKNKS